MPSPNIWSGALIVGTEWKRFPTEHLAERNRGAPMPTDHLPNGQSPQGATLSYKGEIVAAPPPPPTRPKGLAEHPNYQIKRELGRGGMGVVYLAHNVLLGRDEVLKVMGRQIMNRPEALERFLREIRAVARLRHPNIVTAYHATRIGEDIVLAMEYVKGYDLAQLVESQGPLPVAVACNFVYQAALGLQHAHEEGLVHRDIKPGNLMLARSGRTATVKVLDFGLAKATREEKVDGTLTSEGQALGTPDFIAPEQILNAPTADIRADIYSLGGTLFYLLTGRPPFQANSLYDIYQAHISRDAGPLNMIRPEVPAELAALVAKMLAKDPAHRFQAPAEVARSLAPFFKTDAAAHIDSSARDAPRDQATVNHGALVMSVSAPTGQTTPGGGPSAQSRRAAEPPVASVPWQSLIEVTDTERPDNRRPVVARAPTRRSPIRLAAIASTLVGAIALTAGIVAFRGRPGPAGAAAIEKKPAPVATPEVAVANNPPHRTEPTTIANDTNDKSRTPQAVASPPVNLGERWVSLFNGTDKTGWKTHPSQPDNWRVHDGILSATGPEVSHLYTKKGSFKDFHLRIETRIEDGSSGGVHVRSGYGPMRPSNKPVFPISYEAALNCTHPNPNKTGSLYLPAGTTLKFAESLVAPGEWMTLEIIATGRHIVVKVNGTVTTDYQEERPVYPQQGHIALLRHPRSGSREYRPETVIEFRKIEIKELTSN